MNLSNTYRYDLSLIVLSYRYITEYIYLNFRLPIGETKYEYLLNFKKENNFFYINYRYFCF